MYRITALIRGFRWARDYDVDPPLLVVYCERRGIHLTGPRAWRGAALS